MFTCYIALGSNLGDRQYYINTAIDRIGSLSNTRVVKVSNILETLPEGGPPQGRYLNCVIKIKTDFSPIELLRNLQIIECGLGRVRTVKNGPRNIDLDILLYAGVYLKEEGICIPHPRMLKREFVMKPLEEIAPDVVRKLKEDCSGEKNKKKWQMKIIRNLNYMQRIALDLRRSGKTIGFVPTMGALHPGHMSLIKHARKENDIVIVSIFVNPAQFGPKEDYKQYPRVFEKDISLCRQERVDIIFSPDVNQVYPKEYKTYVFVEELSDVLCGKFRPGHFKGVVTIVNKLFNITQPNISYFGQKDAQQAIIIQQMVRDLNLPVKIKVLPTIRERDGLALSSRNSYLSLKEREKAGVLYEVLSMAKSMVKQGVIDSAVIMKEMANMIRKKTVLQIQYIAVVDMNELKPVKFIKERVLICLAVKLGKTRLIDNVIV